MRITLILLTAIAICACNGSASNTKSVSPAESAEAPPDPGRSVVCPVCGLTFGHREAIDTHTHKGITYYFLIKDHREAFAADPETYLNSP